MTNKTFVYKEDWSWCPEIIIQHQCSLCWMIVSSTVYEFVTLHVRMFLNGSCRDSCAERLWHRSVIRNGDANASHVSLFSFISFIVDLIRVCCWKDSSSGTVFCSYVHIRFAFSVIYYSTGLGIDHILVCYYVGTAIWFFHFCCIFRFRFILTLVIHPVDA